jgi:predicted nucleic acid-binding protein
VNSVFLDTDVILDLFIECEPHHLVALRFFSYLQVHADSIQAYTSPVVIANVGYFLTEGAETLEPDEFMKMHLSEKST